MEFLSYVNRKHLGQAQVVIFVFWLSWGYSFLSRIAGYWKIQCGRGRTIKNQLQNTHILSIVKDSVDFLRLYLRENHPTVKNNSMDKFTVNLH